MALGFVNGESRLKKLISATACITIPTEVVLFHFTFPRYTALNCLEIVDAMKEMSPPGHNCHCIISYSTMAPQIKHSFFTSFMRKLNAHMRAGWRRLLVISR
jgi:hypothetical protein